MSGADLFEDDYPHGTVEGFNRGCRGGACPAGAEFNMSCKRAKALSAGDIRYNRLAALGHTPAQIAAVIDGREEPAPATPPTPNPVPRAPKPTPTIDTPDTVAIVESPLTVEDGTLDVGETQAEDTITLDPANTEQPAQDEAAPPAPLTTAKYTAGLSQSARTFVLRSIREWARANGFPGVPTHGRIPQDALAAFDRAHPNGAIAPEVQAPAQTVLTGVDAHVAQLREIREWARLNGYPDVANLTITDEIRAAYEASRATTEPEGVASDVDDVATVAAEIAAHVASIEAATAPAADAAVAEPRSTPTASRPVEAAEPVIVGFDGSADVDSAVSVWRRDGDGRLHVDVDDDFAARLDQVRERLGMVPVEEAHAAFIAAMRPHWSEVAVSEDVEHARNVAARLEQENALLIQQNDTAHRALELTLRLHAREQADNEVLREQLAAISELCRRRGAHIAFDRSTKTLARTRIELLEQQVEDLENDLAAARTPWWKRLAR